MLDFGQINSSKFRKSISCFDLEKSMQEIISIQDFRAKHMEIKVKLKMIGFPKTGNTGNYKIVTDEQRLQQVVMNLLSNALKFSYKKGRVSIECKLLTSKHQIQISVKDTGVGIKEEDQGKLFKLFGFIDTTK